MLNSHEYLNSLTNFESHLHKISPGDFHLDRVNELFSLLGNPQNQLRIIHVAGTKGKGSTCAMIAGILQQAGLKVGLYTSPHLHRLNERIRILDKNNIDSQIDFPGLISDEQLNQITCKARPAIATIENNGGFLTYFEVLTVIAALYFVQEKVDYAIFETGLGGRLDATNAFPSKIAVLTPISLDHTKILGSDLKQIAQEKAGIIKHSKQRVILAPQEDAVMDVLKKRCQEFGIQPQLVNIIQPTSLKIALKGDHQKINAACALAVIEQLNQGGANISAKAIEDGLRKVRWQGRFEIIKENPSVVVDGAHNPASAKALAKTIQDEYLNRKIIFILGFSSDKDIRSICEPLQLIGHSFILTKANHLRSHHFSRQEAHDLFAGKEWFLAENVKDALALALSKASQDDVIVVTGSLFVVAEIREIIKK